MGIIYRCRDCGATFEEVRVIKHRHNEIDGAWYEKVEVCPCCGIDDIEEVNTCLECGKVIENSTLCAECSASMMNEDTVLQFGAECKEEVPINSLYTYVYDQDEIEIILLDHLRNDPQYQQKLEGFALDNNYDWEEFIAEKHGLI